MHPEFRATMAWLHTWAGVILGALMFVMFFMGTLSVFKVEIDRWMLPQSRVEAPNGPVSAHELYEAAAAHVGPGAQFINFELPSAHTPAVYVIAVGTEEQRKTFFIDPNTMNVTGPQDSLAAKNFLYPLHYRLTPMPYGRWVSGAIAIFMLAMMVSGVVIHRKIFVEFFVFRPRKKLPRSSLDLHNLSSVVALPFHILITFTGVLVLFTLYFEPSLEAAYPGEHAPRAAVAHDLLGTQSVRPIGQPAQGPIASIDDMMAAASAAWGGEEVKQINVLYPDDAGGVVTLSKSLAYQVSAHGEPIQFEASSGKMLTVPRTTVAYSTQQWLAGAHLIFFEHWVLRWLYFVGGIAGCIMIATGYIYWMETRRKLYRQNNWLGVRIVEALAMWGVMGLMTATAVYFVANRLLAPGNWSWNGVPRFAIELIAFYAAMLIALLHGLVRGKSAWGEQAWLLGGLTVAAVFLNWATTGDHLEKTLARSDYAIAAMDILLLITATISIAVARKISRVRRNEGTLHNSA